MKCSLMRPALTLALGLSLAACGGGKASFNVAGSITGLKYNGLVLKTNGATLPVEATATRYSFPNGIEYGTTYAVTVDNQPDHQVCTTVNPSTGANPSSDTAGRLQSIEVPIYCSIATHKLGGKVVGLAADASVELANGSTGGRVTVTGAAPEFLLPNVPFDESYGVFVVTQPTNGQKCTVNEGTVAADRATGVMQDDDVTAIVVSCQAASAS